MDKDLVPKAEKETKMDVRIVCEFTVAQVEPSEWRGSVTQSSICPGNT